MIRLLTCCALLGTLLSCGDADDDLLDPADERAAGTLPGTADSDGDGLLDGMEVHVHLTDPTKADSDGDGDEDGWEIEVGLDPLDGASRRYEGGWPHLDVATKAELTREQHPSIATIGQRLKRMSLYDQHGQRVDLYDFARADKPIALAVVSGGFYSPIVGWIGRPEDDTPPAVGNLTSAVRDAVNDDKLSLLLAISDGGGEHGEADPGEAANLAADYPHVTHVPMLVDDGYALWGHANRPFLNADPTDRFLNSWRVLVLDQDMIVRGVDDWSVALDLLTP